MNKHSIKAIFIISFIIRGKSLSASTFENDLDYQRQRAITILREHPETYAKLKKEYLEKKAAQSMIVKNLTPDILQHLKNENFVKPNQPVILNININNQNMSNAAVLNQEQTVPIPPDPDPSTNYYDWVMHNKKRIFYYTLAGTYCSINLYLWYLSHILTKKENWSVWKNHLSLEELYQYKQQELARDVAKSIPLSKKRSNNTDIITPLVQFMEEAESELTYLKSYKGLHLFLKKCWLRRLFWHSPLNNINLRINRLLYMKNAIFSMMEEHKAVHSYDSLFSTQDNTN